MSAIRCNANDLSIFDMIVCDTRATVAAMANVALRRTR